MGREPGVPLSGEYPRRDDDRGAPTLVDDLRSAARSYRDAFATSADPIVSTINDIGASIGDAAGRMFRNLRGNPPE